MVRWFGRAMSQESSDTVFDVYVLRLSLGPQIICYAYAANIIKRAGLFRKGNPIAYNADIARSRKVRDVQA